MAHLLEIQDLRVEFHTGRGVARAVDGLSLKVEAGRTLALVGESGCGKSVSAMAILGLLPSPPARIAGGRILFQGKDLLHASPAELRAVRGKGAAMVFQEPMSSLNPVLTVGEQIAEAMRAHGVARGAAWERAVALLARVGIADAARRAQEHPHRLSGGIRQRVMIAMALANSPALLIADEPTTALDVTIQAQILDLLRDLQAETGMGLLLITHDLGVVAELADEVVVMYAGQAVERAPVAALFDDPLHPYTIGLFRSLPSLEGAAALQPIPGAVPPATSWPAGCRFRERCDRATPRCAAEAPALIDRGDRAVACHAVNP